MRIVPVLNSVFPLTGDLASPTSTRPAIPKGLTMALSTSLHQRASSTVATCLLLLVFCGLSGEATTARAQTRAYVTNCGDNNTVSVIDTTTNTVVTTVPVPSAYFPAATPDGTRVYVTNRIFHTVSVIDTTTNTVISTVPVGFFPAGLAITPDGARAYVAISGLGGSVSVIDTSTNVVVATIPESFKPFFVAIRSDGARAYVINDSFLYPWITVIDTGTNTVSTNIPLDPTPGGIAITPDGARAYVTIPSSGTVSVIDTATNTVAATIPLGGASSSVAIAPDGARAYVSVREKNAVSVIDTATNTLVATIPLGPLVIPATSPDYLAVTPDGTRVYVTNAAINTVSVIDTTTNTVVATIPAISCPLGIAITTVPPKSKDDCKDGGYQKFGPPVGPFKNQGQCIKYVDEHSKLLPHR
jgi:YVTN family beta-propeller protein